MELMKVAVTPANSRLWPVPVPGPLLILFINEGVKLNTTTMQTTAKTSITVSTVVKAPIDKVWSSWTEPKDIIKWSHASDDWHTPYADNDVRKGGKFKSTMAAKDGSVSFDFEGVYSNVEINKLIEYSIADGRKVLITFYSNGDKTTVTETFDAESVNPIEMQRGGWQAILDNFRKYTESL